VEDGGASSCSSRKSSAGPFRPRALAQSRARSERSRAFATTHHSRLHLGRRAFRQHPPVTAPLRQPCGSECCRCAPPDAATAALPSFRTACARLQQTSPPAQRQSTAAMAAYPNGDWHDANGNGLPFRPPTVDEALPYSPFTSIVPFSPGPLLAFSL
jgi:hypothetical protein